MSEDKVCFKAEQIVALKEDVKLMKAEVKELQQSVAETRIYVKQIFDRINDLKELFKATNHETNQAWQPVMLELIKMMGIVAAVIAGIKIVG